MLRFILFPVALVFADLLYKAGITTLDTAVAPPKPVWPKEWGASITIRNHTSNSTNNFNVYYSYANNASLTYYPTVDYLFLKGYKYMIYSNGSCKFNLTDEVLEVPKLEEFNFAGIVKFKGDHLWWWESENYTYGTRQSEEQEPVIAISKFTNESILWEQFTSIKNWPQALWRHPANCTIGL